MQLVSEKQRKQRKKTHLNVTIEAFFAFMYISISVIFYDHWLRHIK